MLQPVKTTTRLTPVRFHFFSLRFTPFADAEKYTNSDLLVKTITYVTDQFVNNKAYLIDRYKNRPDVESRELFMHHAVLLPGRRIRCSICLIRKGKLPMVKKDDSFQLIPLKDIAGVPVETTNFFIDYNKAPAIVCIEYNHNGPRMPDIEYYFRNISNDRIHLAKACKADVLMESNIEKTLQQLHNVLRFEFKVQPQNLAHLDKDVSDYIHEISSLGRKFKPKFLKVEALFQTPGGKKILSPDNRDANTFIKFILNKFKNRPDNKNHFNNFEIRYEDENGEEAFFTLLKDKSELVIDFDFSTNPTTTQYYEVVKPQFDQFLKDRFHE